MNRISDINSIHKHQLRRDIQMHRNKAKRVGKNKNPSFWFGYLGGIVSCYVVSIYFV